MEKSQEQIKREIEKLINEYSNSGYRLEEICVSHCVQIDGKSHVREITFKEAK